jgi:GNAT superfamily N-acetyltransferase
MNDELERPLVEIAIEDPDSANARICIERFALELGERPIPGFDPATVIAADSQGMTPPRGVFLMAKLSRKAIGSVALSFDGHSIAILHRMWVDPQARGLGVGQQLLVAIEKKAMAAGCGSIQLETHSALHEAVAFYRRCGYAEIEAFTYDTGADVWFEKRFEIAT